MQSLLQVSNLICLRGCHCTATNIAARRHASITRKGEGICIEVRPHLLSSGCAVHKLVHRIVLGTVYSTLATGLGAFGILDKTAASSFTYA